MWKGMVEESCSLKKEREGREKKKRREEREEEKSGGEESRASGQGQSIPFKDTQPQ
jgi:hypothetical protein